MYKHLVAAAILLLTSISAVATLDDALTAFKNGDAAKALTELNSLADAGNLPAQIMLGALYSKGGAVKRDLDLAAMWFEKAADQGNAEAQFQLGDLYERNRSPRDYKLAAQWYKKAAQQNLAKAQVRLGGLYAEGLGVSRSPNDAILWFGKAALQGNAEAQYWIGSSYLAGKIAPKNPHLAMGWLTKAAAQKHSGALLLMASTYQKGDGTPKDPILAFALNKLIQTSSPVLIPKIAQQHQELAQQLSSSQFDSSLKLALELQPPNHFAEALNAYIARAHQAPFTFFDRSDK